MVRVRSSLSALALLVAAPFTAHAEEAALGEPPEGVAPTRGDSWDIPGWVIVDLDDDVSDGAVKDLFSSHLPGVEFLPTDLAKETKAYLVRAESDRAARALEGESDVDAVEPLAWMKAMFEPNDPLFKEQWHMKRIGMETAWDYATGRGVTVAVVDTGIACEDHGPFMKGTDLKETRCVTGWNFVSNNEHANDDQGHGTHVAGTIAQSTDNGLGATGVAFNARLMPVKVLNGSGWGTNADVADGIRFAADNGASVINLSLGGPRNSKLLQDAVDHARSKGAVVVAAAGNSGGAVGYPGGCDGAIGVSASDPNDKLASFSSRGPEVDIAAPGVNVTQQTICNGGKNKCETFPAYNGTSMATPHVAGVAAQLVGLGITDPDAVEAELKRTARVVDDSQNGKRLYGAGILDARAAVVDTTFRQAALRVAMLIAIAGFAFMSARKKNKSAASPANPLFVIGGMLAGPGLLFFAPLLFSRIALPIDLLARPLADFDLLVGDGLHRWLPLANAIVPTALLTLTFQWKAMRPFVGGIAAGTAAYLGSLLVLGTAMMPLGTVLGMLWMAGNAAACVFISKLCLAEHR
jgi:serine protease